MDYPRFERIEGSPDRLHLAYHGGRFVELVLRTADLIAAHWRTLQSSRSRRPMEGLVAWPARRQPSQS
jgi:hypothetical protein